MGRDDAAWRAALSGGGRWGSTAAGASPVAMATPAASVPAAPAMATTSATAFAAPAFDGDGEYVFVPYPSPMYYDGRGANKPWLLENPDPMTKITWQSWVELHPDTAAHLDVREGEIVELRSPHGAVRAQVYVFPGVRPDTVAMPIGLGHTEYGRYAKGRGANPWTLGAANDRASSLRLDRVSVTRTGDYRKVAKTEGTPRQLGRGIVEAMAFVHAAAGMTPEEAYKATGHEPHEINPPREVEAIDGWAERQVEMSKIGEYGIDQAKWGMAIDLSRCTGCSACVTACYAENNIPTVGEEQIFKGREMSWMRIERYWRAATRRADRARSFRCSPPATNAPCERYPVYAAYHTPTPDARCTTGRGKRYCSTLPYKVRDLKGSSTTSQRGVPRNLSNPDNPRARGVRSGPFRVQRFGRRPGASQRSAMRDGESSACAQAVRQGIERQREGPGSPGGAVEERCPRIPCARGHQRPVGDHLPCPRDPPGA